MLTIGNITLASPLVLAPMAGISDLPYRMLNRSFGCGLAFTEMISATALAYKNSNTKSKLEVAPGDSPLGIQIVGGDPDIIKRSLDVIAEHSFDIIDFNSACPVKKVAGRGKGAGLLRDPDRYEKILRTIVERADVPVTVKIRAGWDAATVNAVEMAKIAQDAGVSALTIHGRTRAQRYSGNVDYDIIRQVKEAVQIPIIASGDAFSPLLIKRLFDETGCDGVAVARGALGNPWIFPQTEALLKNGEELPPPDVHELIRIMKEHLISSVAFNGQRIGIIHFRKFYSWYTRGMSVKKLKVKAFTAGTEEEMLHMIDELATVQKTSRENRKQKIRPLPDGGA